MPHDSTSPFAAAIHDHLELKRRNAALELEMPLARYMPSLASGRRPGVENDAGLGDEDTLTNDLSPEPPDLS